VREGIAAWLGRIGHTVDWERDGAAKAELARKARCRHTILYREENFVERVRELTDGHGVDVIYDSIGRDTFVGSLD
jgi:NADPH:quinone reductase